MRPRSGPRLPSALAAALLATLFGPNAWGAAPAIQVSLGDVRAVLEAAAPPSAVEPVPAAPAPPDPLEQALLKRVRIDDHGRPEERALLEGALRQLPKSPSCRDPIAGLLREARPVVLSLDEIAGSLMVEAGGKHVLNGLAGTTDPNGTVTRIVINREILKTDSDYSGVNIPRILAHELLGHALAGMQADREGLGPVLNLYVGDELNAEVMGGLAAAELSGDVDDAYLQEFLKSPDDFVKRLQLLDPGYVVLLTREEMRRPVETFTERLQRVRAEIADPSRRAAFETALQTRIKLYSAREDLRDSLLRGSRSKYLDDFDRALEARVARLRTLAPPARPAIAREPPPFAALEF